MAIRALKGKVSFVAGGEDINGKEAFDAAMKGAETSKAAPKGTAAAATTPAAVVGGSATPPVAPATPSKTENVTSNGTEGEHC